MFYETPVDTTVPLDRMKNMDLPKNLHVLYNYTRFHPGTYTVLLLRVHQNTALERERSDARCREIKNPWYTESQCSILHKSV